MEFHTIDKKLALTVFHHKGGELFDGLVVLCERNMRTKPVEAIIKNWNICSVENDITGYGKYSKSTVDVQINNKIETWPISMIYLKEKL